LRVRLYHTLLPLIELLASRQHTDGFWADRQRGVAQVRGTAMATLGLQRLGDDKRHEVVRRAVLSLCAHRLESGALPRVAGQQNGDVLATALGMEAMRRSSMADELLHILTAGDEWLISAQTGLGVWQAQPFRDDFVTAVVLEYLDGRPSVLPQVDGFFLMARELFRRAEEFQSEGGINNRRLGAIATVHAIEMFLYGVFEARDDLGLSAYRNNGVDTLGPREALGAFQEALQRHNLLSSTRHLSFRDQLQSLISRRDNIIHRAHEVSADELKTGMAAARKFIGKYGAELVSLDLLQ
jgi:hypothetical protein